MKPSLVEQMSQRTLNLVTIIDRHKDLPADTVMSGLISFEKNLDLAISKVGHELNNDRSPAELRAVISSCATHITGFGADDLRTISRNAISGLDALMAAEDPLQGEALAHILAWLSMAAQTRVAVKLAFQMSILYGLAPNGAPLNPDDIEDPFDN